MNRSISRLIRMVIVVAILIMLVVFARDVNWNATWHVIKASSIPLLIGAALLNLASMVLKGLRWWVFLRAIGVSSPFLAIRATFAGAGLNNVLLANGGEAARVVFLSRTAHVPAARVLATLVLERFFEMAGYVVLLVTAALILELPQALRVVKLVAPAVLLIMAGLTWWLLRRSDAGAVTSSSEVSGWRARLTMYKAHFGNTVASLSTGPRFLGAMLLSIASWGLQVATYHVTAQATHLPMSLTATFAALLVVNLSFALRLAPGNVGFFQLAYAGVAAAFGLGRDAAVATAFAIQAQQILPVTLIGVLLAPEFIFKARKRRASDAVGTIPVANREDARDA